jgi:hypothetical protein
MAFGPFPERFELGDKRRHLANAQAEFERW